MCKAIRDIKDDGRKDGVFDSVRSLMESMSWSAKQAMDALKVPPAEQKVFAARLGVS